MSLSSHQNFIGCVLIAVAASVETNGKLYVWILDYFLAWITFCGCILTTVSIPVLELFEEFFVMFILIEGTLLRLLTSYLVVNAIFLEQNLQAREFIVGIIKLNKV